MTVIAAAGVTVAAGFGVISPAFQRLTISAQLTLLKRSSSVK